MMKVLQILCAFLPFVVQAQQEIWNEIVPETSSLYPNTRILSSASYCEQFDTLILLGGNYKGSELKDLWAFDFKQSKWDIIDPKVEKPEKLNAMTLTVLPTQANSTNCQMLYAGGVKNSTTSILDGEETMELWMLTITKEETGFTAKWDFIHYNHIAPSPLYRIRHSAALYGSNKLLIYGGESPALYGLFDDLWEFTLDRTALTGTWKQLLPNGKVDSSNGKPKLPISRSGCSGTIVSDETGALHFAIYGGTHVDDSNKQIFLNDMWYYNINKNEWIEGSNSATNSRSFARFDHTLVSIDNHIMLFGGFFEEKYSYGSYRMVFDSALFTTLGDNPLELCNESPTINGIGLWCQDKFTSAVDQLAPGEAGIPYQRFGHVSILRKYETPSGTKQEVIIYGGYGITDQNVPLYLNRIWALDADKAFDKSNGYLQRATESLNFLDQSYSTMFFVGSLLVFGIMFIILSILRRKDPAIDAGTYLDTEEPTARGARFSFIKRLPLVEYHANNEEDVQSNTVSKAEDDTNEETDDDMHKEKSNDEVKENSAKHEEEETKTNYDHVDEEEWREMCSICLVEFEEGELLRELPCKHVYHPDCVDEWLLGNKSCPLCKQDVDLGEEGPTYQSIVVVPDGNEDNMSDDGIEMQTVSQAPNTPTPPPRPPGLALIYRTMSGGVTRVRSMLNVRKEGSTQNVAPAGENEVTSARV